MMKKYLAVLILIMSILSTRFYPIININSAQFMDKYSKSIDLENSKNFLPKYLTIGALGFGEVAAGFTLAEVLITLLIIGFVSSLVIPSIIQDSQDAELKTAWKKTYSVLSQASQRVAMDNGGNIKGLFTSNDAMMNAYLPYLQYIKTCKTGTPTGLNGCWHSLNNWYFMNGEPYSWAADRSWAARIVLNDSTLVLISGDPNCISYDSVSGACIEMDIDINGFNKPNTVGKDIFGLFVFQNGKTMPFGSPKTIFAGDCTPSQETGWGCSSEYLK